MAERFGWRNQLNDDDPGVAAQDTRASPIGSAGLKKRCSGRRPSVV